MCNTCGCSAAEDFEAEENTDTGTDISQEIPKADSKNVDVGRRSLSADRRRKG